MPSKYLYFLCYMSFLFLRKYYIFVNFPVAQLLSNLAVDTLCQLFSDQRSKGPFHIAAEILRIQHNLQASLACADRDLII